MADQIVACPGCGKKYKVGEGSPAGEFQCTSCGGAVAYGASPAVAKAKPVQAHGVAPGRAPGTARGARGAPRGGPRGGARGPGRGGARGGYSARGRGRGGGRPSRYAEDDEMGYGPPQKDNTMMYVLLAVIAVLIVGGGVAFVALSGGDEKDTGPEVVNNPNAGNPNPAGGNPGGGMGMGPGIGMPGNPSPVVPVPDTGGSGGTARPGLQPRPGSQPGTGPDANKPDSGTGSSTGGSRRTGGSNRRPLRRAPPKDADLPDDLHGADVLLLKRMTVEQFLKRDIPHLDDTTAEQKSQIDTACRYLVDYSAARKQTNAVGVLARIGRPAFPRVLSSFKNITSNWVEAEGRTCICLVNETLWEIMQKRYPDTYMVRLSQMSNQSKEVLEENVRRWFVWWYSEGYQLKTFAPEEEEEDMEDD